MELRLALLSNIAVALVLYNLCQATLAAGTLGVGIILRGHGCEGS